MRILAYCVGGVLTNTATAVAFEQTNGSANQAIAWLQAIGDAALPNFKGLSPQHWRLSGCFFAGSSFFYQALISGTTAFTTFG